VRHRADALERRQAGDEQQVADPATQADVGLDDVHGPPIEQLGEGGRVLEHLAARDRDVQRVGEDLVAVVAMLRQRLLVPVQAEPLQLASDVDGRGQRVRAPGIDHQADVTRQRLADGGHERQLLRGRVPADAHLDRPEAALGEPGRLRDPLIARMDILEIAQAEA
jgi:hypothetical protein